MAGTPTPNSLTQILNFRLSLHQQTKQTCPPPKKKKKIWNKTKQNLGCDSLEGCMKYKGFFLGQRTF